MSQVPDRAAHLSPNHRDTLLKIFDHPVGHNIEWPAVLSLIEAVAEVERRHDGKYVVTLGDERQILERPKHKDVDTQQVIDLRHMLAKAGYGSVAQSGDDS
jgi:hypothetical protein